MLTAPERLALRSLPKAIQDVASKALRGSVRDMKLLSFVKDHAQLQILLPVYYVHLEPSSVPEYICQDAVQSIMLAKWSLFGIVSFYTDALRSPLPLLDDIITDAMMPKWNCLFPWLSFLIYKVIMGPTPPANTLDGYALTKLDALRILGELFGALCQYSSSAQELVRSVRDVRRALMQLWIVSVDTPLLLSEVGFDMKPSDVGVVHAMRTTTAAAVIETLTRTDASPSFVEAAGGITPFVLTALKFLRITTLALKAIPANISSTISTEQANYLVMLGGGLSHTARLMLISSQDNPEVQEAFVDGGSITTIIETIGQLQPRLLVSLGENIDHHPQRGLPFKRQMLSFGYAYLLMLIDESHDVPRLLGQMINAGVLETIVDTRAPRYYDCDPDDDNEDIRLLRFLPPYLMYRNVLTAVRKSIRRIADRGISVRNSPDVQVRQAWSSIEAVANRYTRLQDNQSLEPFYDHKCGSVFCTRNDQPLLYRCKACMVICYCSKKCQRAAWKHDHKARCRTFRAAVGRSAPSALRKSLPLIAAIEREEWKAKQVSLAQLIFTTQKNHRNCRDRIVIEMDFSVYPIKQKAFPLEEYMKFLGDDPMWKTLFAGIEMAEALGQRGFMIGMVKIPQRSGEPAIILSPDHAVQIHMQGLGMQSNVSPFSHPNVPIKP